MLYFMILRLLYGIYFIGVAAINLKALSTLLMKFNRQNLANTLQASALSFVWILLLFSDKGRKKLSTILPFIGEKL